MKLSIKEASLHKFLRLLAGEEPKAKAENWVQIPWVYKGQLGWIIRRKDRSKYMPHESARGRARYAKRAWKIYADKVVP